MSLAKEPAPIRRGVTIGENFSRRGAGERRGCNQQLIGCPQNYEIDCSRKKATIENVVLSFCDRKKVAVGM